MSARVPRTRFAAPFVITIAGATGAVAACVVTTSAGRPAEPAALDHRGGSAGGGSTVVANPPRPAPDGSASETGSGSAAGPDAAGSGSATSPMISNPPRPAAGSGSATVAAPPVTDAKPSTKPGPPVSKPAAAPRAWRVAKVGKACQATEQVDCPSGAACNPPPPVAYACPKDMPQPLPVVIYENGDAGSCTIADERTLTWPCPSR
jgi:hypothetical protein